MQNHIFRSHLCLLYNYPITFGIIILLFLVRFNRNEYNSIEFSHFYSHFWLSIAHLKRAEFSQLSATMKFAAFVLLMYFVCHQMAAVMT